MLLTYCVFNSLPKQIYGRCQASVPLQTNGRQKENPANEGGVKGGVGTFPSQPFPQKNATRMGSASNNECLAPPPLASN